MSLFGHPAGSKIDPNSTLHAPLARTTELAQLPTRLQKMDYTTQQRLINWGYAICSASVRTFWPSAPQEPEQFPYPETGV